MFQGLAGRMMLEPLEFLHQARLTDRNLIMFRDVSRAFYQRGLGPEIPNIPALIRWQRELIGRLPHAREVYCVGSSSGAYAALLCGHFLRAKAVWAFAPPTNLKLFWESEQIEATDQTYADLRPFLESGNGTTQYHVHYNEASVPDREAAAYLEGCPGVELHAASGTGHGVIIDLARTGELQRLLPPFVPA
jgi:hypothetical protein